jgi:hypothetical protein
LLDSFQGGKKTIEVTAENIEILKRNKNLFGSAVTSTGVMRTTPFEVGDILTFKDITEF